MQRATDDEGITLVEVMIALGILLVVLSAGSNVLQSGLRSLSESHARQTSSQISTMAIEELRNARPERVRLNSAVSVAAVSNCTTTGGADGFDPDGTGSIGCEELAQDAEGIITSAPPFAGTLDNVDYITVSTLVDDANVPSGTVRVTVQTSYDLPGGSTVMQRQAFFSEVSRG